MELYSYCNIVGQTDVGCKRAGNEDWLDRFECKNGLVAVVCDGMGGHVGGEVASHLAVETIRKFLEDNYFSNPCDAIVNACNAANEAIIGRTLEKPELTGMGATCVMLIVRDGKVYYGSVGDSRIYLVRSKRITQLTVDQSYVQMLVDMGEITKEQAEHHPRKNEITNALGLESMKPATVSECPINPEAGDCFILCSDGLSGMVSDNDILKIAGNQTHMSQADRVDALINLAKKNGGLDNITCQIVEFAVTPSEMSTTVGHRRKIGLYAVLGAIAAILVGAIVFVLAKPSKSDGNAAVPVVATETDSIVKFNGIKVKLNKPFMDISENHNYGSIEIHVYGSDENKDTVIIRKDIEVDSIIISPERHLNIESGFHKKTVAFNSIPDKKQLSLEFTYGDSTYKYFFPIEFEESKVNTTPNSPPVFAKNTDGKATVLTDETGAKNDVEESELPLSANVNVNSSETTTTIYLYSMSGTNTNNNLFTDRAIEIINKQELWYRANCSDRRECKIEIENDKVPLNAMIIIPLANTPDDENYRIYVQVVSSI